MVKQWIDSSIISDNRWRSPTNKSVSANYSTDQKNFTSLMFNIKLEEKSYKMSFKALLVKIQRSKSRQGGGAHCLFSHGADGVKEAVQSTCVEDFFESRFRYWKINKKDDIIAWKENSRQPQKCIRWKKCYRKIPLPESLF